MTKSAASQFWQALESKKPLQIVGTVNAYVAIMAKEAGFQALYLSGAGVANSSYGLPDLGVTTLDNVLEEAFRILNVVDLPLLVDIDTGWGSPLTIERTIKTLNRVGVAGAHIEDQAFPKRCGHLPGKTIVSKEEMVGRIKAAVNAKHGAEFVVMARTDAFASEGLDKTIERAIAYKEAGADMLFPEALTTLEDYQAIKNAVGIPILANLTEFGKTPLFTTEELAGAGVDMALYPLSVSRAMYHAAWEVLQNIKKDGTQKQSLEIMQTRKELYQFLKYEEFENKLEKSS